VNYRTPIALASILALAVVSAPAFAAAQPAAQQVNANTAAENLHNQQAETTQAQINSIFQEMSTERIELAQGNRTGALSASAATAIHSELANQQAQLANLGVTSLSSAQVRHLEEESGSLPQVTTPPSTSDVNWSSSSTTYYYDGKDYTVQQVWAEGLNANSNLAQLADGIPMYSNQQVDWVNGVTFLQMAVETAAQFVPYASWVPTAFLPNLAQGLFSVKDALAYEGQETVSFSFVNPSGEPQYQQLCFVSNWDNFSFTQTIVGFQNGHTYHNTPSTDKVLVAPLYNHSLSHAVAEYVNPTTNPRYSWVEGTQITSYENDGSVSVYFTLPEGMGEVY
jgi:hypothetical protein